MKKIAIFISGAGSNAERMVLGFAENKEIKVSCLISTKENLRISSLCEKHSVSYFEYVWQDQNKEQMTHLLLERGIEWIILAGFLKKIPDVMIKAFPNRIINLHPSLGYLRRFMKAWVVGLPIAIAAAFLVGPLAKMFVDKITK